jgi:hypothetical protein
METPLFQRDMRLRVHAFEEKVSIDALRSTFTSPNPIRPYDDIHEMSMHEIRRKADAQIANVLSIGKMAREVAFKVINEEKNAEKLIYDMDVTGAAYTMLTLNK